MKIKHRYNPWPERHRIVAERERVYNAVFRSRHRRVALETRLKEDEDIKRDLLAILKQMVDERWR